MACRSAAQEAFEPPPVIRSLIACSVEIRNNRPPPASGNGYADRKMEMLPFVPETDYLDAVAFFQREAVVLYRCESGHRVLRINVNRPLQTLARMPVRVLQQLEV
jgi:hypothetical protein